MKNPRVILITGASSGIGAALAETYARPDATLALTGRDGARLERAAAACRAKGADVIAETVDVTDKHAMADWIGKVDADHPIDLVIANAGISAGTGTAGESPEQAESIRAVNVEGVMNTILPALNAMKTRKRGQIAIMSSLAGFLPLPGAPSYAESKRIVREWGEKNRQTLATIGIEANVICPGFVVSRITDQNPFPMPFLMAAEKAANIIKRDLKKNKARIAFPWPMVAVVYALKSLPDTVLDWILGRAPKKPALD